MAFLGNLFNGGGFDASQVEPSAPMEIIPPGKYVAQIVKSEMIDTKGGSGQMLKLELEIIDGPHARRKLWDQLNLVNPNQQAVEIAQRTLSAICHAIGRLQVNDSDDLHFKPMLLTVAVEPDSRDKDLPADQRRMQNRIKGYAAPGGDAPSAAASRPQQGPAPARAAAPPPARQPATAAASPPWRRSA
jgi:hypothetical protein